MSIISFRSDSSFKEKRRKLIENLRKRGIKNEDVLRAMSELPRELFVHSAFVNRAYEDIALPIDCEQTISQPYTVAYMTEMLDVIPGQRILEIGTGSGYQAALLYMLGAEVYSSERHQTLYQNANSIYKRYNLNINTFLSDGTLGLPSYAPFDRIIVTAGAPEIPLELVKQLKFGGKLVAPVGGKDLQIMKLIVRVSDKEYDEAETGNFQFVPLIGERGWKPNA